MPLCALIRPSLFDPDIELPYHPRLLASEVALAIQLASDSISPFLVTQAAASVHKR